MKNLLLCLALSILPFHAALADGSSQCHRHLLIENLKELKKELPKISDSEAKKNAVSSIKTTLNRLEKALGKTEDFSKCDEKKLKIPIGLDLETGQLIVPITEDEI